MREQRRPVSWLEAPSPAFPGSKAPVAGRATVNCLLQWRGRAGIAPDFRVASFAVEQLCWAVYRGDSAFASATRSIHRASAGWGVSDTAV